ncbi:unnamed protein product [Mesocestoides corti]|uniref:Uncharacterized protein n=1 Tax=Mesocestoides corti TaxID=53468 RepID=A0A0R3UPT0_MESCO|nr:unnamed protein product [Mesocestoides corti]
MEVCMPCESSAALRVIQQELRTRPHKSSTSVAQTDEPPTQLLTQADYEDVTNPSQRRPPSRKLGAVARAVLTDTMEPSPAKQQLDHNPHSTMTGHEGNNLNQQIHHQAGSSTNVSNPPPSPPLQPTFYYYHYDYLSSASTTISTI